MRAEHQYSYMLSYDKCTLNVFLITKKLINFGSNSKKTENFPIRLGKRLETLH